jgi:predicted nucleic-acid-binding protein
MKTLIDETVILRYLLNDHRTHSNEAARVIGSGEAYTYPEIFARAAVSLRDVYRVPRSQISYALLELMDDIYVVDERVVRYATRLFGSSMLDYVDCLLVARNVLEGAKLMSFDKPIVKRAMMSDNKPL